jgi:ATP synthase protein I
VPKSPPKQSQNPLFSPQSGLGFAYRVGIEFISGILVGLLLGYAVDHIFGTQPWGLVVMVLLGASAGLLTIFRMLGLWENSAPKTPPSPPGEEKDG